ncbi:MAG: hypothetical protein FJX11_19125 [Alphaproteobacteria bacterium]|nr:hypothetical protein [Alphaproteobacteria bacterium]
MPIHLRISHHDRMVVCVAHGTIGLDDIQKALKEYWEADALAYRKIIDVASANSDATFDRLVELLSAARNVPNAAERGPVAFVVDAGRGETVRDLARLTEQGERPIGVFTNLHDARKWLDEVSRVQLKG